MENTNLKGLRKRHGRIQITAQTFYLAVKNLSKIFKQKVFTRAADIHEIHLRLNFSEFSKSTLKPFKTMDPSLESAVQQAPVVTKKETSFSEKSQESKVEQIANGTVESSVNSEKSVTQSVQSSVQASGDQTIQQKR